MWARRSEKETSNVRSRHSYSSAVFFIGMAMLFVLGWWWPGMLVVLALTSMASAYERGQPLFSSGRLFMLGLALAFALGGHLFLPMILIVIGLSQLPQFQRARARRRNQEKRKEKSKSATDVIIAQDPLSIDDLLDSSMSGADGEYENLDALLDEDNAARR